MKITILPDNIEISANPGENLLEAIARSHVLIDAGCAGNGVCGQCRVRIEKGELDSSMSARQNAEEYAQGWRQACLSKVKTDLAIFIPETSRIEREFVAHKVSAPKGQFLAEKEIQQLNAGWEKEPLVKKIYLELPPPSKEYNSADMQRLLQGLRQQSGLTGIDPDFPVLKSAPQALRAKNFKLTASISENKKLVRIEPGDHCKNAYALAVDIGTTTVSGQLLDLNGFKPLATVNNFNQQKRFGADVITRIVHAGRQGGMADLKSAVVQTINQGIDQLLATAKIKRKDILFMSVAGNTTMAHLLLGMDPQYIRLSPYTPASNIFPPVRAKEIGIKLGGWAQIFVAPCVASYVGGDIVAGVLASGIYKREGTALYIDIGTNGEIVLGNREWMFCASCSAGPAFEGGSIKYGITASESAIERFYLDESKLKAAHQTIGNKPARGICGSGIINITAELLRRGLIERNGKIKMEIKFPLVRQGAHGPEVVIAPAKENALGEDIVFTEPDLDNLIRAKAAMFAGYCTLLKQTGLEFKDLEEIIIAGNFGSYLDIENAICIGLLPDVDRNRIKFIGNGSLIGARLIAFSSELKKEAVAVAAKMNNIELGDNSLFNDEYMAAMFLPHTSEKLFPSVMGRIAG
jgi:uncharacterized 2Fe-2S/4Fe-4S cluster protein (DUF4445 family)